MHRQVHGLSVAIAVVSVISLAFHACTRQSTSAPEGAKAASSKRTEFAVNASIEGPVSAGAKAALLARVEARNGFHINPDYPVAFRPEQIAEGIKFDRERYQLQNSAERIACSKGSEHVCELRGRVPFTAASPGDHRVTGILAFSVCNAEKCLIEKAPIDVRVSVR